MKLFELKDPYWYGMFIQFNTIDEQADVTPFKFEPESSYFNRKYTSRKVNPGIYRRPRNYEKDFMNEILVISPNDFDVKDKYAAVMGRVLQIKEPRNVNFKILDDDHYKAIAKAHVQDIVTNPNKWMHVLSDGFTQQT